MPLFREHTTTTLHTLGFALYTRYIYFLYLVWIKSYKAQNLCKLLFLNRLIKNNILDFRHKSKNVQFI